MKIEDDGWGSDPWFEKDGFVEALLDKVHILDILDKYEIPYAKTCAGNFSHKLRCPLPDHDERTASFHVSEENNDFHCFGCNANGNVIDLIVLIKGATYYRALEILHDFLNSNGKSIEDIDIKPRKKINPEHTIEYHVFRSGVEIRKFLHNKKNMDDFNKWQKWAKKQFDHLDKYLDNLDDDRWEKVNNYYNKLKDFLSTR